MVAVVIGYGKIAHAIIDNFNVDTCLVRELSKIDNSSSMRKCSFVDSYKELPNADIYIIAVCDDAIEGVLKNLQHHIPRNSIVTHTSGSISLDVVSKYFKNPAVIYPLCQFPKNEKVDFDDITVLVECCNNTTKKKVIDFLGQKKCSVKTVDSQTRAKIHISAIFACNFTNHIISLSQEYLNEFGYDISILKPILKKVLENINNNCGNIASLQTGPAIREDYNTIEKHIEMLKHNPKMLDIYKHLTNSIIEQKNENEKL